MEQQENTVPVWAKITLIGSGLLIASFIGLIIAAVYNAPVNDGLLRYESEEKQIGQAALDYSKKAGTALFAADAAVEAIMIVPSEGNCDVQLQAGEDDALTGTARFEVVTKKPGAFNLSSETRTVYVCRV
jgi:hypothetical protein